MILKLGNWVVSGFGFSQRPQRRSDAAILLSPAVSLRNRCERCVKYFSNLDTTGNWKTLPARLAPLKLRRRRSRRVSQSIIVVVTFLLFSSCSQAYLFTSFHEPADKGLRMLYSYNGYDWKDFDTVFLKPEVGNQKVMRDPSIAQGPNGTFHLVWTSSWHGDKGFGYASSADLIHWSQEKFIPVMENEPALNVWAPELFYDNGDKQFIIIWASCIPGRFERGAEEDSNNHRLYVTTTKDFQIFSATKLFFDPGFSVIDAVIVKRGTKDYVLVLKDNTRPERDIKVAFADNPLGPYKNTSKAFTNIFTEGPSVVKIKDDWLIYYDSYRKKIYEASATKDFRTFTNITVKVSVPEGHKHGTIFVVRKTVLTNLLKYSHPK